MWSTTAGTQAEPQALYDLAGTVGRCICQDTIKLRAGEWVHANGNPWCRS